MVPAQRIAALLSLLVVFLPGGSRAAEEIKFKTPGLITLTADFGQSLSEELKNQLTQPEVTGINWTSPDLPAWLTLNKATGQLTGNPPASSVGSNRFRINAIKNESGELLHPFDLVVRAIPQWDTADLDLGRAKEGTLFTFDLNKHVTDPLGGSLTFTSSALPGWLSLNSATGILSGTAKRADVGSFQISSITATGRGGAKAIPAHGVVDKTIQPPRWTAAQISLAEATDDKSYTRDITEFAVNPEGTTLTYSKISGPAWVSIDENGVLSGSPSKSDVGPAAVKVRLATTIDGLPFTDDTTFNFNVKHVPKPPTWSISDIDLGKAQEDSVFTFDLKTVVTNPEPGPMTFTAAGLPSWLSLSTSGILTGTPRRPHVGPFGGITVTATNAGGPASAAAHGLVLKTIKAPKWVSNPIAIENAKEEIAYSKNLVSLVVNPEGTALSFDKVSGPAWASIASTGALTGTPAASDIGPVSIVAHFTTTIDGQLFEDTTTLKLNVLHVPKPPAWAFADVDLGQTKENQPFRFDLKTVVTDPEGGALTFAAAGLPPWMSISPGGILSGTPRRAHVGPYSGITITATNVAGPASAKAHGVVLKVIVPPRWSANPITLPDAREGFLYSRDLLPLVVNPEGTVLSFDKVSGAGWLSISGDGALTGTPGAADVGPASVLAHFTTTIDGQVFEDTTTLKLNVVHVPKPPAWAFADIDLGKAQEGSPFSFDLKTVVTDPEGGTLTFTATGLPAWLTLAPSGILSGTPRRPHVGPFSGITVTATGAGGPASAKAHGVVLKTIQPPKWTGNPITLPDATETLAYLKDLTAFVTNPEGSFLGFDKVSGPAWIQMTAGGVILGTPQRPDVGPVQLVAHFSTTIDGKTFEDTTTFVFTVKKKIVPPKWISNPVKVGDANDAAPYTQELSPFVLNPEGTPLTYEILNSPIPPPWLSIQALTGLLFGAPQKENVGSVSLRVRFTTVIDGQTFEDTTTVQFRVLHQGKPPLWLQDPIDLGIQLEGQSFTFDLKPLVTNPEGGAVTFTATGLPGWLALSPSGVLSGTPRRPDVGKYAGIVISATGTGGTATAKAFGEVKKVIQPPRWKSNPITLADAKVDTLYVQDLSPYVSNPEQALLTYSQTSGPTWTQISSNGQLAGTPGQVDVGKIVVIARFVTTIDGQPYEDTTTFLFNVVPKGKPPVWNQDPIRFTALVDRPFQAALAGYVVDPGGLSLRFQKTNGPDWLSVGATAGALSGTPRLPDLGENAFRVSACNTLGLCAEVTVLVTVRKEPPIQTDDVQIDGEIAGATIENLWVVGNLHHASKLMKKLKDSIHIYYEDLAAANVSSSGVYLSADGRRKGEPVKSSAGATLLKAPSAGITEDFRYRTDKAYSTGLFTKRFNSPIWSMFKFYEKLPSMSEIYKNGYFMPEIPMETLIVTANRDHFICWAKKTPQESWNANDFANHFISVHKAERKPYRISAVTPVCPTFQETSCDEKPQTAEGTYQTLIHATKGKHYPIHCDNIDLVAAMHDYAKESIFRARLSAHRRIKLSKTPLDASAIKVSIAGVSIPGGEKWSYDAATNEIAIRWELIDDLKLQPGDRIKIEYKVASVRSAFIDWLRSLFARRPADTETVETPVLATR